MRALLRFPERIGWRDHLIGAALALGLVAWLLLTAHSLGCARDEGFYFRAAAQYARWFQLLVDDPGRAFDRAAIDRIWSYNHEHPSLMKSLFGLSWLGLNQKWHIFRDPSDAFRFPAMCMAGLTVWVTYLFGARAYSRPAGIMAAFAFALTPRVFYHAHLACFDIPIVAMWTLCIYVYWRSLERGGLGWALVAGVVYGLTLETKHNAWILPFVFLPHALVFMHRRLLSDLRQRVLPFPASLLAMALLGPPVFVALWPWMWHDTVPRFQEYFNFHFNHVYYNMEFLGRNYFDAPSPRGYMPLMVLATVPSVTLALFLVGTGAKVRQGVIELKARLEGWRRERGAAEGTAARGDTGAQVSRLSYPSLLFGLAVAAAIAPWLFSKTPIFGGTKHWMTAYPFLALFAGHGFVVLVGALNRAAPRLGAIPRGAIPLAMAVCLLAAPLAITVHSHPFGLSSYVPLVGGTRGGAALGLNRQFWGFTTQTASERYLAANAPPNATVFIHDTAWDSWGRMVEEGRVRPDLRPAGAPGQAQYSIVHHELHMNEVEYQIWVAYETRTPVYVVTHDDVPVVTIYRRR